MVLNFVNADIEAVARTMATISGRNVVVDPRVKGTISLSTDRPVSPAGRAQPVQRCAAPARLRPGGHRRPVQDRARGRCQVAGQPGQRRAGEQAGSSNQIVTQIFNLNHESANNLVPVLRPLIGPNNTINVNPGNNSLVITDYADNLQRIGRIIAHSMCRAPPTWKSFRCNTPSRRIWCPWSRACSTSRRQAPRGQAGDPSYKTTLVAEPRSNCGRDACGQPGALALVRSLVTKLDQPTLGHASGNIHVVYLKNADAVSLATTLRAAMAGEGIDRIGGASSRAPHRTVEHPARGHNANQATAPVAAVATPSTGGQIQADPATNSLIITAPEPQYRQLRAVIDKLDSSAAHRCMWRA